MHAFHRELRCRQVYFVCTALSVLPAVVVATGFLWWRQPPPVPARAAGTGAVSEKSIAVLPFESLSDDQRNAFFATGIQDEILTDLAKVADLKVISRTSVTAFGPGHARNVREIGLALGVAYLVEGSVQRAAGRVRVTVQLIDARTDVHRWAEHYDGDLSDLFSIQSQMAERIVASLRARLSPDEKAAIDTRPTADLPAYELYLQARELVDGYAESADWRETLLRAARLLDEATARDGRFALAYCLAARVHDQLYFFNLDSTPSRLALEGLAVDQALLLQPDLGEAHLARALLLCHGQRDYPGARRELDLARATLPNAAELFSLASYVDRREGRWPEARSNQAKACALDPRNPTVLDDQLVLYDMLRLYPEEIRLCEAAVQALPKSADYYRLIHAEVLLESGDTASARRLLGTLPAAYDPGGATTYTRVCAALYDGQPAQAEAALAAFPGREYTGSNGVVTPRAWLEATVARARGDEARAQAAFLRARTVVAENVRQRPDDPAALALLGQIDAGLGRREDALREGRGAVAMRPVTVDAMDSPGLATALALICAWTGETAAAMDGLAALTKTPGGPDYGQLHSDPAWAPLRAQPEFMEMLAGLDPGLKL